MDNIINSNEGFFHKLALFNFSVSVINKDINNIVNTFWKQWIPAVPVRYLIEREEVKLEDPDGNLYHWFSKYNSFIRKLYTTLSKIGKNSNEKNEILNEVVEKTLGRIKSISLNLEISEFIKKEINDYKKGANCLKNIKNKLINDYDCNHIKELTKLTIFGKYKEFEEYLRDNLYKSKLEGSILSGFKEDEKEIKKIKSKFGLKDEY